MNAGETFGIWHTEFLGKELVINDIDYTITSINKLGHRVVTEFHRPITIADLEHYKADMAEVELKERVESVLCA